MAGDGLRFQTVAVGHRAHAAEDDRGLAGMTVVARQPMATLRPSSASRQTIASPSPEEPPVTTAVL